TVTAAAVPVCIEFGPPPALGTAWGVPTATPPGSWIFTENGIPVWIDKFFYTPTATAYNYARILTSPVPIGTGQQAYLERVDLRFDFSNVGFPTSSVTWEWYEPTTGAPVNMAVNGGPLYIGNITAPAFVSGKPYAWGAAPAGTGRRGRSQIGGAINTLRLGGERLWIDRVCANP
ncbi:MAG TPA: hypothetical protein VF263_21230, partial [Longimicrobiaceae bacterium]